MVKEKIIGVAIQAERGKAWWRAFGVYLPVSRILRHEDTWGLVSRQEPLEYIHSNRFKRGACVDDGESPPLDKDRLLRKGRKLEPT
jgi:hypothetical protein